jgi:hypothetical protein
MNQRIRELALEAGEYVNSVYTPPVRSNTPGKIWEDGHIGWHEQFNQKFAELIVQECADKCLEMAYVNPEPHHYAAMLKEHFGVEEHHAD